MENVVKEHLNELKVVCENHHVQTLYLFGSGATSRMNSQSDLDFLVQFNNEFDRLTYADNFFSLLECLETLFGRKVDLITVPSLKNPILKSEIENTKVKLYAA